MIVRIVMRMDFTPSKYQKAIFDKIESTGESLIIEAVAGSGKTTTIVKGVNLIPPSKKILFLAFNKAIATELGEALPKHCQAKTFHSVGFAAWRNYMRGATVKIEGNKTRDIVRKDLEISPNEVRLYMGFIIKLVGYAKNAGIKAIKPDTRAEWEKLVDHFDLTLASSEANLGLGIGLAHDAFIESIKQETIIDFDDMLFMPLIKKCAFFKSDVVVVDEAQDTNEIQQELLKRMIKSGGRLIAVGDSRQAIYGFRGADSNAMTRIADFFNCAKMPLTVSYRCPQAVVRKAREVVGHIEAHESAPEGEVKSIEEYAAQDFHNDDAILCRNVAPLISFAYGLIARGKGCKVLGREIGQGLVRLVEKQKAKGIDSLILKLAKYFVREMAKAKAKENDTLAEKLEDEERCISAFISQLDENHRTIPALVRNIEALFSDDRKQDLTTLCSVHKSKGLEWGTVYLLDADELMPSKYATKDWQMIQEQNLIYVAYTRAKSSLRFISSGAWRSVQDVAA